MDAEITPVDPLLVEPIICSKLRACALNSLMEELTIPIFLRRKLRKTWGGETPT